MSWDGWLPIAATVVWGVVWWLFMARQQALSKRIEAAELRLSNFMDQMIRDSNSDSHQICTLYDRLHALANKLGYRLTSVAIIANKSTWEKLPSAPKKEAKK